MAHHISHRLRVWQAAVAIALVLVAFFLAIKSVNPKEPLLFGARYEESKDFDYDEIKITGNKLTYKTFVFSEPRLSPIGSGPIYSEKDLTEKEVGLTKHDIETLASLVKRTGFFSMAGVLGKDHGGRYYPTKIEFTIDHQQHEVTFRSSPDSGQMPPAFRNLQEAMLNLARSKTNLHPENNPWQPVVPNWDEIFKSHQRRATSAN